ncbi:MAG: tRNA (adenosine(37)-N6)-threonylcarbamoyltransferase complex ATPase subunit type 1 TsaE [Patescibacteria group bacterium]
MEKNLTSLEDLQTEAVHFVSTLTPKADAAVLVTLSGELGAGKTSFTQGLARALGITESITSPTFVLEKIYDVPSDTSRGFARLVHVDAYRLEGEKSLIPLEFSELCANPQSLIVLEWPEMVEGQLPKADHALTLTVLPDDTRAISYA